MSTFFESAPNGTLGFEIQKKRIWIVSIESFIRVGSMDSKSFFWICPKEQKIHFWIRNPDLDFDQKNVPLRLDPPCTA